MEQVNQSSRRTRRNSQQISALISKYNSSGLTIKEFCERNQIHKSNFHKWVSRSKQTINSKKRQCSTFAAVQITASENMLFAEVNGIRIYQPVTATYLKELKG